MVVVHRASSSIAPETTGMPALLVAPPRPCLLPAANSAPPPPHGARNAPPPGASSPQAMAAARSPPPPSTDSRSLLGAFPMRASHPVRREVPSAAANSHGTELPWPRVPLPAMDARSSSSVRHPKIPSRGPELHLLPPLMELRLPSSIAGEGRQSGRERGGTRSCRAGQLIRARARRARGWRACD